jgi:hypothetical protein
MKENFAMIILMERENSNTSMAHIMTDIGKMDKEKEKVLKNGLVELPMLENSTTTSLTEKALKPFQTHINILDYGLMEKNVEKEEKNVQKVY